MSGVTCLRLLTGQNKVSYVGHLSFLICKIGQYIVHMTAGRMK